MEVKIVSSVADPDPAFEIDRIWICILPLKLNRILLIGFIARQDETKSCQSKFYSNKNVMKL